MQLLFYVFKALIGELLASVLGENFPPQLATLSLPDLLEKNNFQYVKLRNDLLTNLDRHNFSLRNGELFSLIFSLLGIFKLGYFTGTPLRRWEIAFPEVEIHDILHKSHNFYYFFSSIVIARPELHA